MQTLLVLSPHKALGEALADELPKCKILSANTPESAIELLAESSLLVMEKSDSKTLPPAFSSLPTVVFTRPVRLRELLYTINARLQALSTDSMPLLDRWTYSPRERTIASPEQSVALTEKEGALFSNLLDNIDIPIQREQLLSDIWGYSEAVDSHTLETHIYRLRNKLKQVEIPYDILATEEGGYKLSEI